ncbi:thiolase family protein [Vibrio vulnificus]|uniref:thiolase family protein n=1 Tax=Vibrio vulnificus TaxID=672 RepID=UPI0028DEA1EA|nr:thiolase family protein [Vibrio vulnificus]MDT8802874.1 thiolase family protein [Vibrio vulnificus]
MTKSIWIVAAKRTPIGRFQGALAAMSAPQLGAAAIRAAMGAVSLSAQQVDEVYMGCVLPAGCGQAPARQAALKAELGYSTPCTTVNKVCGSGMKAVMLAYDQLKAGDKCCMIAGGMESMTNAPYLLKESRSGMRMGHKTTFDHMFLDGLQDAYEGHLMGVYAQQIADKLQYTREQMDTWAIQSAQRATQAQQEAQFKEEITPIVFEGQGGILDHDEHPTSIRIEKIPTLKPAFAEAGTVTAANSSAIADGAAALILADGDWAEKQGLTPLAIIRGHASHARLPAEFTVAPVYAIQQLLSQLDWDADEVDLWEINEAFAVVTQIAVQQLGLAAEKVNIKGGACALGHPIGASGARILVTLIHSLRQLQALGVDGDTHARRSVKGVAALCIGGGEATAIGIEIPV